METISDFHGEFKKVIFLDIEGPLVTHRSILQYTDMSISRHYSGGGRNPDWWKFMDLCAVGLVYKLAVDYKAQIVLTSTLKKDKYTYHGLIKAAPEWLSEEATSYLSTAITGDRSTREEEIQDFIRTCEVEKYVVIDDRRLDIPNLLWCNPRDGFLYDQWFQGMLYLADDPSQVVPPAIYL